MSRDQQRIADYLAHILEAIERIGRDTGKLDQLAFLNNQLVQDAMIRNFEIIGEASSSIEKYFPEFAASHPELPLAFACQMRNAVSQGYFKVDFESSGRQSKATFPALRRRLSKCIPAFPLTKITEGWNESLSGPRSGIGPMAKTCGKGQRRLPREVLIKSQIWVRLNRNSLIVSDRVSRVLN